MQAVFTIISKFYPTMAQLRPAIIPYVGSKIESAVDWKLDITESNAVPTFVIEVLYALTVTAAAVTLVCKGEYCVFFML